MGEQVADLPPDSALATVFNDLNKHARRGYGSGMSFTAAVLGGSGYAGGELVRILAQHPNFNLGPITAASNAGTLIADRIPALAPVLGDRRFSETDPGAVSGVDVAFVALPHGESQTLMESLTTQVGHVVDLGADFRLPLDDYTTWYGAGHGAPTLLDDFQYGLVEVFRDAIGSAQHIANPGCYPTAANLALAPALANGWLDPASLVVNAASGISGAGRSLKDANLYSQANESVTAYGLLTHRHTAEIEWVCSQIAGQPVTALFTPHLAPMTRGIHATATARLSEPSNGVTTDDALAAYREFYADSPFVVVSDNPPSTKSTFGANTVYVTCRIDQRTGHFLGIAVEDNLVKGAAGQAVQCANLLLGLDETAGLPILGVTP